MRGELKLLCSELKWLCGEKQNSSNTFKQFCFYINTVINKLILYCF